MAVQKKNTRKKVGGKIAFSEIPNKWAQKQKCSPTRGNKIRSGCLIRASSGAPKRAQMLSLHSRGSPNKGEQSKKWLPHPYLFLMKKGGLLCPQNTKFGRAEKFGGCAKTSMTSGIRDLARPCWGLRIQEKEGLGPGCGSTQLGGYGPTNFAPVVQTRPKKELLGANKAHKEG